MRIFDQKEVSLNELRLIWLFFFCSQTNPYISTIIQFHPVQIDKSKQKTDWLTDYDYKEKSEFEVFNFQTHYLG